MDLNTELEDSEIDEIYFKYTDFTAESINNGDDPATVASIMIRLGLELYRTIGTEKEFDDLITYLGNCKDIIQPLKDDGHLH
jgi:hypothetical protein